MIRMQIISSAAGLFLSSQIVRSLAAGTSDTATSQLDSSSVQVCRKKISRLILIDCQNLMSLDFSPLYCLCSLRPFMPYQICLQSDFLLFSHAPIDASFSIGLS